MGQVAFHCVTNWTNKQNRDRHIDRQGVEGLSKKEKGLIDMENSVVITGGSGV